MLGVSGIMLVYVGTYTVPIGPWDEENFTGRAEGIYIYRFDESSGALEAVTKTAGVANPSYLAIDSTQNFLYAVNELRSFESHRSGTVSAFAIDRQSGRLHFLNRRLTHGSDPCYVLVDKNGKHVLVTNYTSGSVCVLPVGASGELGEASDFIQYQGAGFDPVRQEAPHAHSVTFDKSNRFAFVADLGSDKLMIYRFDRTRGMLVTNETPWIKMRPGTGPRHMDFHPSERFAYLINELNSTVAAMSYDRRLGKFRLLQVHSTLPNDFDGENTCADIHVAPSGKFVYGSNRGHDSIVIYEIDQRTGKLTCLGHELTQGKEPRNFAIDPTGKFLLAANQNSDTIVTFRINSRTGKLDPTGHVTQVPSPVCLKFLRSRDT
jgi:6-phosphogluconolactonase